MASKNQSEKSAKSRLVLNLPLHHAYCLIGEVGEVFDSLKLFLEQNLPIETVGNPDFWHGDFLDGFGVDESRDLINRQLLKAAGGGKKIIIVKTPSITWQAQNALLKVFEEPTANTHFFLILPSAETLLLTFKSRLMEVSLASEVLVAPSPEAVKFLKSNLAQKFELIKAIAEAKDARLAINFLSGLESNLAKESVVKNQKVLSVILKAKNYLNDPSPSIKMLLDWVVTETS